MIKSGILVLAIIAALAPSRAAVVSLDKLWQMDAPDDWWYSDVSNRGALRVYTFGTGSPDPIDDPPILLAVANASGELEEGDTVRAFAPQLIRGISIGIARAPMAMIDVRKAEKFSRKGKPGLLTEGYRQEIDTVLGKLMLGVFVFSADKLPGKPPLPNADKRLVIVHIAGKSAEELETFIKVFDSVRVWAPQQ